MVLKHRLALLLVALMPIVAGAEDIAVTHWLTAGPLTAVEPLFADSADRQDPTRYLDTEADYHDWQPADNQKIEWMPGQSGEWKASEDNSLTFSSSAAPTVAFAASYISSSRWQETQFTIRSTRPVAVWLDGKYIDKQTKPTDSTYEVKPTFTLHRGKHLLLITSANVSNPLAAPWTIEASASLDSQFTGTISFDTDPRRAPANYADWGLFHELASPVISPDGKRAAVVHSERDKKYKKESWLEIYDTKSAALIHTIRPGKGVSRPFFFPKGNKIAFRTSDDDGTTIWSYDLTSGTQTQLVAGIKGLDHVVLSPDERFLYYTTDAEESEQEQKANYRHLDELEDKVVDWTGKRKQFVHSISGNVTHEITELGTFAFDRFALSREGDQIAFVRYVPKSGRPYYDSEIWTYDVNTHDAHRVISLPLTEPPNNLTWLPGGNQLAYTAGSHTVSSSDTIFPNTNQHPLYLLDLATSSITNLTPDQTFSVADQAGGSVFWNPRDKQLYFLATLGGTQRIMKVDPNRAGAISEVKLSRSLVDAYALSADGSGLTVLASSPLLPFADIAIDLKSGKEMKLLDPNKEIISQFQLATYEQWNFTNSDGDKIEGWLHFPPDFNPNRKWPTIVYYYGGVSPRDERFTFTYHWWAANGYVVYVLNPVGSIGYGQAFADKHSNDWGTLATRDVIEGTKMLVASKPFVDEKRLGAYGGSYGGFITLDLLTKTDLFAAAVDMYGISNIASYFGGGTWGHLYGDLALPGSYPWSHRETFIEKSPLYHADQITTPVLILHGESDNNVPPVESDQMFAALKLLGREVEYVRFKDETHNINVKFENLITHREMMLEWFDKYLKDQPEGWEARWKQEQ